MILCRILCIFCLLFQHLKTFLSFQDVDLYKSTVREDIECWMKILNQHNIQDWMIVLVETYDLKKSNKLLLRTTVLDKIRSDFAAKNGDR